MGTVTPQEVWDRLKNGVINFDEEMVVEAAKDVILYRMDVYDAIMNGLVCGIEEVGELYERGEYFVPEMMMCTDALYSGLNILRPHLKREQTGIRGQIIIGVVQGDIHDIGKNIIKMMFDAVGFEVHDLGRDVPLERFINEQLRTDAEIVCLSAMMTNVMPCMNEIIKKIKEKNPSVKIMVGGAPLNEHIARRWGADGFAREANDAIKCAIRMVSTLRKLGLGPGGGEPEEIKYRKIAQKFE
ncbi:cobalamin B12-binding domain-containing protein [Thermincola ferriacetica]|uniref:Cobalamin B12-binding domain-containing protein n=1 Tax=Thermincola ferriacetica TaxID=281456 RepID=A0A0L6W2J7_9FIRM|nr:corrinoid protein [Thermincola ferriacetica]KNZ69304.1 cobalamin B12-binding domain-containing protein [Thermincola ferriacetica]